MEDKVPVPAVAIIWSNIQLWGILWQFQPAADTISRAEDVIADKNET